MRTVPESARRRLYDIRHGDQCSGFRDASEGARWFDVAAIGEADRQKIGRDNSIKLFKLKLS